jgi:hypothetical protein
MIILPEEKDKLEEKVEKIPRVGDVIYVDSALFIGHGRDDFCGGKAHISNVKESTIAGKSVKYYTVAISERPGTWYSWHGLAENQEKLKERFGDLRSHKDPDYSPQFNEEW